MKHPIRAWLLGAFLLALASVSSGETVKPKATQKHAQQHVQKHAQTHSPTHGQTHAAAAAPASSPPSLALPAVSKPYTYQSPFEREYGSRLGKTTAATPGIPDDFDAGREAAPNGPRKPSSQVDSDGVPNLALHPQTPSQAPPMVTVGEWDLSADAHLPITHSHDTGAAISARHGF
jgi:hypothetical protein